LIELIISERKRLILDLEPQFYGQNRRQHGGSSTKKLDIPIKIKIGR